MGCAHAVPSAGRHATLSSEHRSSRRVLSMDAAAPRRGTRVLNIVREAVDEVGLRLQEQQSSVFVRGIKPGSLVDKWNADHPLKAVQVGDRIASANGKELTSLAEATIEFRQTGSLEIVVTDELPARLVLWQLQYRDISEDDFETLLALDDHAPVRSTVEPMSIIGSLPLISADAGDSIECSICLDDHQTGDQMVRLPCQHLFHPKCIAGWMGQCSQHTCPLCVQPIEAAAANTSDAEADIADEGIALRHMPRSVHERSKIFVNL
eukprot:TRINITY_DN4087_c0_g1_i1.p1 TRINITY_DN4087_c0_g1~~TRINITY_DN4087_c0_g1_i1.p1  ORF type:complete len:265 (-),score=29.90 TRINITY_DN4087_c0_g1_i1:115-909(-)